MLCESQLVIIPQHVLVPVRYWQITQEISFSSAFFYSVRVCRNCCLAPHLIMHFVNRVLMLTRPIKQMQQNYLVPTHPLFPATLAVSTLVR